MSFIRYLMTLAVVKQFRCVEVCDALTHYTSNILKRKAS
uniref:Uncharacterized protein n=1 Tax=Anguilla anguilla TaxID=7936 RepID=A0A0E9WEQ1_ANGAN